MELVYDYRNLDELTGNLSLHDSIINEIITDYSHHRLSINIYHGYLKIDLVLIFEDVLYTEITHFQLRGEGKFINSISKINGNEQLMLDVKKIQSEEAKKCNDFKISRIEDYNFDEAINISLLLNSGDTIKIISKQLRFQSPNI